MSYRLLVMMVAASAGCGSSDTGPTRTDGGMGDLSVLTDLSLRPDADDDRSDPKTMIESVPLTEAWGLPGLDYPVQVLVTEGGAPNLYAQSRSDLGRVLGFILARDRYFIMDMQRRLGLGTISALLGDLALESDIDARLTGIPFVAKQLDEGMSLDMRSYLGSVVDGINAYLDAVRAGILSPPIEFSLASGLLAASPSDLLEDWTLRDMTAMAAVVMYQTTFDTSDIQRSAAVLNHNTLFEDAPFSDKRRSGFLRDVLGDLSPLLPYSTTTGFGLNGRLPTDTALPAPRMPSSPDGRSGSAMRKLLVGLSTQLWTIEQRLMRRTREGIGSNVWAVSGSKTEEGFTLVAGDGHLPLSVPPVTYLVGLDTSVYGEEDNRQVGILMAQLPVLGAGTNGHVAWSQVNPYADTVDWYAESLQLDPSGRPTHSFFQGEWRPLVRIDETYQVADVPALGSQGRQLTHSRYQTFDGRLITEIEGIEPTEDGGPSYVFQAIGRRVIPGDTDDDGVISAISFDYTAFDGTTYLDAANQAGFSKTAEELRESMKGLVGNGLYTAGGDKDGNIFFSSYQGFPCRSYLERDDDGRWMVDAHPRFLLDGKRYGGFNIPTINGSVDESKNDKPYQCVIPFDEIPQAVNPETGYLVAANNDPAGATHNGALFDDPRYIGGPWNSTRAHSIARALESQLDAGQVNVESMTKIQAERTSRLGEIFAPYLIRAIDSALSDAQFRRRITELSETRLAEYRQRIEDWIRTGCDTPSGVETFYDAPSDADRAAAVATMIFNVWIRSFLNLTWDDEGVDNAWTLPQEQYKIIALKRFLDGRGPDNPKQHSSWIDETGESVFFDRIGTDQVETSTEVMLLALEETDRFLSGPSTENGSDGGFGTQEMSNWLWGMRHQARFESLLADFVTDSPAFESVLDVFAITTATLPLQTRLTNDDPRRSLKWFPRGGDQWAVDAANPGMSGSFRHKNGPVMRMVIGLKAGEVKGRNILPGGQSGDFNSPHFADQLALWLANETVPMRFHVADVVNGSVGRLAFSPSSELEYNE
ncbi:MAG: penicillin acylase family protein [Myxococcota bacterium]|nr:penicillin acylase family protein [Myxococcota bacterium]